MPAQCRTYSHGERSRVSVLAPGVLSRWRLTAGESRALSLLTSALLLAMIGVELAVLAVVVPETVEKWWRVDSTGDFGSFLNHARDLESSGLYSPALSLLLYPLTHLDVANAFRVFVGLGALALLATAYLAQRGIGSVEGRLAMALAVLSVPQMHWALRLGHLTPFLALAALGAFLLLRRRPFLAGLCFALLVLKPQYLPIPALYLLWTRNGRALMGLVAGALVMEMVGFAAVGFGTIGPYLSSFFDWGADARDNLLPYQQAWQYAWQGFLVSAHIEPNPLVILDLTVLSLGAVLLVWWRGSGHIALAAAALGMVLVTPYANFYDWGLLVVAGALLLKADVRWKPAVPAIAGGLYLGLLVSQAATPFPAVDVELGTIGSGGQFSMTPAGLVFPTKGIYWITPAVLAAIGLLALMAGGKRPAEASAGEAAGTAAASIMAVEEARAPCALLSSGLRLPGRLATIGGLVAAGYFAAAFLSDAPPFMEGSDPFAPKAVLSQVPDDFPLPDDSKLELAGEGSQLPYRIEWTTAEPVSEVAGIYRDLLEEDTWELMMAEQTSPSYRIRLARFTPHGFMTHWAMLDVSPSGPGSHISLDLFVTQALTVSSAARAAETD